MTEHPKPFRGTIGRPRSVVPASTEKDLPSVLYVEDDDVNWRVANKRLSARYRMVRASNARQAFAALKADRFNAVLMDIELADSDLNGIEITRALRGNPSANAPSYARGIDPSLVPPIIFVTAYTARYSKTELIGHGGDDVVSKPVDLTMLHLAIARCIARSFAQYAERKKDCP